MRLTNLTKKFYYKILLKKSDCRFDFQKIIVLSFSCSNSQFYPRLFFVSTHYSARSSERAFLAIVNVP